MRHSYLKFQDPITGEMTWEYEKFWDDVTALGCLNFDCNQVAEAMLAGLTPEQAVALFNLEEEENFVPEDYEDHLNHDMSMNH